MKGKIDKYGHLYIIRVRAEIAQFCPLHDNDLDGRLHVCGDWCPLFGELEALSEYNKATLVYGRVALSLCRKTLIFDEFTDEREGGND